MERAKSDVYELNHKLGQELTATKFLLVGRFAGRRLDART